MRSSDESRLILFGVLAAIVVALLFGVSLSAVFLVSRAKRGVGNDQALLATQTPNVAPVRTTQPLPQPSTIGLVTLTAGAGEAAALPPRSR